MNPPEPSYYSSLGPFRDWFAHGLPLLTWHKLGPRPRRVRLRGLYLPAGQFAAQLGELTAAHFQAAPLDAALLKAGNPNRRVVLTFDDGYANVLQHGLEPLARHRACAIQFLVADRLGKTNDWDAAAGEAPEPLMDDAQVREWLAAGHTIGSHTLTHPFLTRVPAAIAREEVSASRKALEDRFGRAIEHFCYPYGDWNAAVRDLVMEAGYRTACTTEFGLNEPGVSPWALKRLTVRYATRNLKAWIGRFFAR